MIVGWFVGIGMFIWFSWIAIGVNGWIISVSSAVSPPVVFCKFINPFCTILSISYFAIQHKSSVPEIVKTFLVLVRGSSLLRHTNAPVFVLIPLIVYPPLPITSPISLVGTSTYMRCEPVVAPLVILRCVSTIVFNYFLTLSTASGSPSTKIFLVFDPGALPVATCTF